MKKHRIPIYGMTENPGGIETYLLNLFKFANKNEITLDFVTDSPSIAYKDFFETCGARIYLISPKGKNLFKHMFEWRKLLIEHPEYKTIYFNVLDAGAVFSMLIPWLLRCRIVVHSHNADTEKKYLHHICKPFLSFITKKPVACSQVAADYMFLKKKAKKSLLIPNAIDIYKFRFNGRQRDELREKNNLKDKFVVCHVGRIAQQKNPYGVIDIFDALYQKNPDSILLYVGTGNMENEIKEFAFKKKSYESIRFLGIRKDIPDILQLSDVFLLPSFYEGLPIVAIEAQASGIPCVLSDTISKEVQVMPSVIFKSLTTDSIEDWAQALLETKKLERSSEQQPLTERGYDITNCCHYYNELIGCLVKS